MRRIAIAALLVGLASLVSITADARGAWETIKDLWSLLAP